MTGLEAAAITAVFRALAPKVLDKTAAKLKESIDKIRARFESTFTEHLRTTLQKCSSANTIFTGDETVPLKSIYINLYISKDQKILRDDDVCSHLDDVGDIIVHGTGGAGKTMLMKYLALSVIENPISKIPLFVELRNLPSHGPKEFYQTIFEFCTPKAVHDEFPLFKEGLKNGAFLLFLDGLDEVPTEIREQIYNSIRRIAIDYPQTRIIASTRPEIDTRNWGELDSYKVRGLNLDQAKLLVKKVEFVPELKEEFLQILDENFFSKHESFLSVPLLCSLMLFTFGEYREVPSRLTVFYEQAFETLFRKHDRMKPGYFNRQFECKLSADRFRTVFSAFCYRTLALSKLSFSDEEFHHHIRRAAEVSEVEVDAECFGKDLVSAICVIMRDGLRLHFIHRSFQEYFAALFLLRYRGNNQFSVYNRILLGPIVNDVASMAHDIDAKTFEREWALPAIQGIRQSMLRAKPENRAIYVLRRSTYSLRVDNFPPSFVHAWSWSSEERDFRQILETLGTCYRPQFFFLRPTFFRGEVLDGGDFCTLADRGEDVPRAIKDACAEGSLPEQDYPEDQDFIEIVIGDTNLEWLRHTSLPQNLQRCVDNIEELYEALKSRVMSREEIDILN